MPDAAPELMAATPSDVLRKLRAQLIIGDVTDRLSAVTSLLTALVDKELLHETRAGRDKQAAEAYAKAQEKADDLAIHADGDAPRPPAAASKPLAGAAARR